MIGHQAKQRKAHETKELPAGAAHEECREERDRGENQQKGDPMSLFRCAHADNGLQREDACRQHEQRGKRPHHQVPPGQRPGQDRLINVDEAAHDPVVFFA